MVGERVTHIRFGEVKTFAYPQSVDRFISFDRENAREQARRDREQADVVAREKEMAKMLADRQKAEEAAQQRMEQLHEKKVTEAKRRAARSAAARASKATGGKNE